MEKYTKEEMRVMFDRFNDLQKHLKENNIPPIEGSFASYVALIEANRETKKWRTLCYIVSAWAFVLCLLL